MATQASASTSDFIKNLGKMYGTYTGGFIGFILLLAVLEQVGVPNKILGYLFVFFTLAVYAIIGVMTRTAEVSEYYVAGRRVPGLLQRHGDRRRLDVGGVLRRHGRHLVPAWL